MKNSREHWSQLGGLSGGQTGGPGRPGPEGIHFQDGDISVLRALQKPQADCHSLESTVLQITDDRLLLYKDYKDYRLQATKIKNLTN